MDLLGSPSKRKKNHRASSNTQSDPDTQTDDEDDQPVAKRSRSRVGGGKARVLVPATQMEEGEGGEGEDGDDIGKLHRMDGVMDGEQGQGQGQVNTVERKGHSNGQSHTDAHAHANINMDECSDSDIDHDDPQEDDNNDDNDNDNVKYEQVEDEDGTIIRRSKIIRKPYTRDKDGFVKGSIIRVRMSNFVTYDYVDFKPGPHLNMIIGPNGTGKSTIVCGITLGLGWPPKVLGRATDISAFVKQGHERGWVEITLKNGPGESDIKIKREINRRDKKSVWGINDQQATMQQVSDTISKLDIQVGNLCSFLPQDKVAEFAQMSSTTLLTETMKAAGDPGLSGWHHTLITDGKEKRLTDEHLEKGEERLEVAVKRVNELQPQVDLLRNRQVLQRRIAYLKALVPAKQYYVIKAEMGVIRREKNVTEKLKKRLEEKHQPLKDLLEVVEHKLGKAASRSKNAITLQNNQIDGMNQALGRQTRQEQKFEDLNNSIQALSREDQIRKDRITQFKTNIKTLERQVENPPDIIDDTQWRKQQTQISIDRRAKAEQIAEADAQRDALTNRSKQLDQMREQKTAELQRLKDVKRRRMYDLSQRNASCGYAMKWIEEHRDQFEHEVFFPPAVSVDVSDLRYAPIVEALINGQQMMTFVCQSEKDYKTLNQLNDDRRHVCRYNGREQKVMINTITITERDLEEPTDMLSPEQLEEIGLDCYAIQLCDAPPPILAFLRTQANLHRAACSLSRINGDLVEAAGILSYVEWLADDARPRGSITRVSISSYGSHAKQSSSRVIYAARVLASSVDQERVSLVSNEVAEISTRKRDLEGETKKAYDLKMRLLKEEEALRVQLTDIKEKIAYSQNAHKRWKKAAVDLELNRTRLEEVLSEPTVEVRRAELKAQVIAVIRARIEAIRDHHAACEMVTKYTTNRVETELAFIQAITNKNAIDAKWIARSNRCAELEAKIRRCCDELSRKKEEGGKCSQLSQEYRIKLDREEQKQCLAEAESPERTLESVKEELADARSEMGLIPEMDRGVIERLDNIKEEVKQRRKEVEKTRKVKIRLAKSIDSTMAKFDPALTTLVETVNQKFSSALERIGCAGEVRIRKHANDYAHWALEILVKFRDEEELQVLTAQRQSGGERSLSTIMYLMSLTELARTPFSLVDEINQGMDQRAERAVHDQLVETTCNENAGQYFLITPKLLTGLRYDERMKVLCINNGEYLPDPQTSEGPGPGDLLAYLAKRRERKAGGRR